MTPDEIAANYTPARTWEAAGSWVAATVCTRCGVTLLLDPANTQDVFALHEEFHASLEPK
jgi:hypothetical protein